MGCPVERECVDVVCMGDVFFVEVEESLSAHNPGVVHHNIEVTDLFENLGRGRRYSFGGREVDVLQHEVCRAALS